MIINLSNYFALMILKQACINKWKSFVDSRWLNDQIYGESIYPFCFEYR